MIVRKKAFPENIIYDIDKIAQAFEKHEAEVTRECLKKAEAAGTKLNL